MAQWLDRRPWHIADVAEAASCSPKDAEALLWAFGFAESNDGLFRRQEDDVATALSENMKTAISSHVGALSEQDQEVIVRRVLEQLNREGRVPESDESGWPWFS